MKTKKVLLGSLALAGLCAACTNEEIVDAAQNNNAALSERTQVNLSLSTPSVDSRFGIATDGTLGYTSNDLLGAVLVDKGYATEGENVGNNVWNNVCWNVVDGHVGNNKWAIKDGIFQTAGTTAVGSWVFYTKYNEKMTTTRNGIEFDFPQIQDGAADFSKIHNNNINFMVSPVAHIDGYEGEKLNFNIGLSSVYSYLQMLFDFSAVPTVKQVQKIVVKAKDADGEAFKFPQEYRVVNTALPEAKLSLAEGAISKIACTDLNGDRDINVDDQNIEMQNATKAFMYSSYSATNNVASAEWADFESSTSYVPAVEARSEKGFDCLVVDYEGTHGDIEGDGGLALTEGKFSGWMLMPAGVYSEITFEIYTNEGVYIKTVNDRYAFVENLTAAEQAAYENKDLGKNEVFLRPNTKVAVSDIENVLPSGDAEEYLKIVAADCQKGSLITKTADLINYIDGIKDKGTHNLTIITQDQIGDSSNGVDDEEFEAHTAALINKAVMDALVAKEAKVGDIQLVLNSNNPVKVVGEATAAAPLYIHDITFNNSCVVVSGNVTVGDAEENQNTELIIPEDQKMLVKGGVNLVLNNRYQEYDNFEKVEIESGAAVTIKNHLWIKEVVNAGTLVAETELDSDNVSNTGTIEAKNLFDVEYTLTNKGTITSSKTMNVKGTLNNAGYASLTNSGEMTLTGKAYNYGTLANSGLINVQGAVENYKEVTIAENARIHVNSEAESASLLNKGTITNSGRLDALVGYDNTITNLGTIDAKSGSMTYITKNSEAAENATATNAASQIMGTMKIAERRANISVTTLANQGYIEYVVTEDDLNNGILDADNRDQFNKVILSSEAELTEDAAERIRFIETSKDLSLPNGSSIQEVTFTDNAKLYAGTEPTHKATIAKLTVKDEVMLTIPPKNNIYVEAVRGETSGTNAQIYNDGEIIVGGDLYTTIIGKEYADGDGTYSAGDGNSTAIHWNTENVTATEGYQITGTTAKVLTQEGLAAVLANSEVKTVELAAGDFDVDFYNLNAKSGRFSITGVEGTKIEFKNLQVRASQFEEVIIENCEILRMPDKTWGMLVFATGNKGNGVYTVRNCTFNGAGSQGIYINETVSGATYNIENCTFNGDFGGEGAITIQNNEDVEVNVNVKNCTFNGIPSDSHKIFILYGYDGWNLNTDLNSEDIFWQAK